MIVLKTKRVKLTILFLFFLINAFSQDGFSAFLKSSAEDVSLDVFTDRISFLDKKTYRPDPIKGIEFRVQNNQFGSQRNEYGLRVTPANPWEIKHTNRLFKSVKSSLTLDKELALKEILALRYSMVIDLLFLKQMREIRQTGIQNKEHQILILEKQRSSSFFNAEKYVELKLEHLQEETNLESDFFMIEQKINEIKSHDPTLISNPADWSDKSLIPIEKLLKIVDSLMKMPLYTTTRSYLNEQVAIKDHEYALEKANLNLGFVQTEYSKFRLNQKQNPIGISLGIAIPIFNANKGDMAERKLDKLEAEGEMNTKIKSSEHRVKSLVMSLKSYIERYYSVEQKIISFNQEKAFSTVSALNNSNPITSLKFKEQLIKLNKLKAELTKEIYLSYIHVLAFTDLIQQKPLINYVSKDLKPL